MAVDFIKTKKRQRYLLLILALVIIATLVVIWYGFFQKPTVIVVPLSSQKTPQIEINLGLLQDTEVEALKLFESISPFSGEIGRENPFITY